MGWFYSITEKGILLESLLRTVSNIKVIFSSKKRSIFSYSGGPIKILNSKNTLGLRGSHN